MDSDTSAPAGRGYGAVLATPSAASIARARITGYRRWLAGSARAGEHSFPVGDDYAGLWQWSVDEPAEFWASIWEYFGVLGTRGGGPLLGVRSGIIAGPCLGAKVEAFDSAGKPVIGEVGELVLTVPMPSMPVGFWGDDTGERYAASYFADYPGAWRHGDWIMIMADGGCVIYGRSDATLNRGGVRMGTSEFYRVVEELPEVTDSLVIDTGTLGAEGRLLLFLVLAPGCSLDDALVARIRSLLRSALSPRHVPDEIRDVPGAPRTLVPGVANGGVANGGGAR